MKDTTRVRLDKFDAQKGLDRGKPVWLEALWYLTKCGFFLSPLPWPTGFKAALLRLFGANVGKKVNIKPRVNIHFPWKLTIDDYAWIGEEVFILNFEPCSIGRHACISQRVFLCGGNHDYKSDDFALRNGPITVEDGAWVGAQSFVGPSVTIHQEAVVTAGSVVTCSLPHRTVCSGNPCTPRKERYSAEP